MKMMEHNLGYSWYHYKEAEQDKSSNLFPSEKNEDEDDMCYMRKMSKCPLVVTYVDLLHSLLVLELIPQLKIQLPDMNEVNLELPFPFFLRIGAIFSHFIVGRYNL